MKSLDERLALMTPEGRLKECIKTAHLGAFSKSLPEDQREAIGTACYMLALILDPTLLEELHEQARKADL